MTETIEKYIATNNQREAMLLLKSLGAPKPKNEADLINKLEIATVKFGDKVFEQLAEIDTPYRRLILSKSSETKSNCSGCGGKCSGVDGVYELENFYKPVTEQPVPETEVETKSETNVIKETTNFFKLHPVATGVGATILALAVIVGVVKSVK